MKQALTDAQVQQMCEHVWRQRQKPLEPMAQYPTRMVPFNQLPEAGAGHYVAEALRLELAEEGYSSQPTFMAQKQCLNCGETKRASDVEDGWCSACSR